MTDLNAPISQMGAAWKLLHKLWDDTKLLWDDPVSQSFERRYWTSIEDNTQSTLKEMQQLSQVIVEAHRKIR